MKKIDTYKHASLFSGIGGFDLAAEWMGWGNVFNCEIDSFCRKILKHYWPQTISYEDIRKTDFTIHRHTIDVLSGGFPCQPYSLAGKRKGKEDDRHLWPEMLRAIREIQPVWVVGENVYGIVNWSGGLVFEEVQADLEAEGYEVWSVILPAASVNAPHKRDRAWFIAYSSDARSERMQREGAEQVYRSEFLTDTYNRIRPKYRLCSRWKMPQNRYYRGRIVANSSIERSQKWKQNSRQKNTKKNKRRLDNRLKRLSYNWFTANTTSDGFKRRGNIRIIREERKGRKKRPKNMGSLQEKNWENFPTQSPICGRDDGLPTELDGITFPKWRGESIKGFGNAVLPKLVYQIFKIIDLMRNLEVEEMGGVKYKKTSK